MTPREIRLFADGFNEAAGQRWKQGVTLAYLTAQLVKTPELPPLSVFLGEIEQEAANTAKRSAIWAGIELRALPGELGTVKKTKKAK